MRKIIIVKSPFMYYDRYTMIENVELGTIRWEEVTDDRYLEVSNAISEANSRIAHNRSGRDQLYYHIVELSDTTSLFKTLDEFLIKEKEVRAKYERKCELEKQKKEKAAQERKRKQLEKLKKELGENENS